MEGQLKLKNASVLLVGTGGLGAPLGMYLAAAGVGRIGLVDFDVVDFTNLHRQIIHGTKDVGRKKLDSAADTIADINPNVKIEKYDTMLSSENALEICKNYDLIIDGTDNFPDALPGERRLRAAEEAQRLRIDLPLRGPGDRVRVSRRALLPVPVSRAATSGPGSELRRGRRAGNSAGHHRADPGDRSGEADPGRRRAAGRPPGALRRSGHALPRAEAAPESGMPGVRRSSDHHEADRLSGILRDSAPRAASGAGCQGWRDRSGGSEGDDGSRVHLPAAGCARAARVPDLQHSRIEADSRWAICPSA